MLGRCLSSWGLWHIVVMPSKLIFFPLSLIRKRETVFHLYLDLKDIPSSLGGVVAGWDGGERAKGGNPRFEVKSEALVTQLFLTL